MTGEDETEDEAMGTGGLTLEPPTGPNEEAMDIGFAPDLDRGVDSAAFFEKADTQDGPVLALPQKVARERSYPIAEAALDRLLDPQPGAPEEPLEEFEIGPSVMRPPPVISTPAPAPISMEGPPVPDLDPEDLVDMMLVGKDDGGHQIHLAFKEEVMGGLYVTLERREAGLFATFLVDDVNDRRHIESTVGSLLIRFEERGLRVAGHEVKQRE